MIVACPVCNKSTSRVVFSYDEPDQYEVAVGVTSEGYERCWVQCTGCGLYYSVFSRDPDVLDRIYTSAYRDARSPWRTSSAEETFERVVSLPENESETKYRVTWIKDGMKHAWDSGLVTRAPWPQRMLDIGGATGVFAYEFQDDQWRSHVIDLDESGNFINRRFNIPFLQKRYEPKSFGFPFQLVSMIFLFEHVADPSGFLRALHADIGPSSFVYIEVPDEYAFHFKPPDDDIFNSCHLWMFGPQTLMPLLDSCGYTTLTLNRTKTKRGHYSLMVLACQKAVVANVGSSQPSSSLMETRGAPNG